MAVNGCQVELKLIGKSKREEKKYTQILRPYTTSDVYAPSCS